MQNQSIEVIESVYGGYQELWEGDTFLSLNKSAELSDLSLLCLLSLMMLLSNGSSLCSCSSSSRCCRTLGCLKWDCSFHSQAQWHCWARDLAFECLVYVGGVGCWLWSRVCSMQDFSSCSQAQQHCWLIDLAFQAVAGWVAECVGNGKSSRACMTWDLSSHSQAQQCCWARDVACGVAHKSRVERWPS